MPQNLEIKARLRSFDSALAACRRIKAIRKGVLKQTDTYFHLDRGRLKLREIDGKKFELIYYTRPTRKGSRYSKYVIIPLKEPKAMRSLLSSLLGVARVVTKSRILFLYKNARIHLDSVQGLGTFIEFEVLVKRGKRQARGLMEFLVLEFGLDNRSRVAGSYVDLLLKH